MPVNHSSNQIVAVQICCSSKHGQAAKRCTIVSSAVPHTLHIKEGTDLCITLASITRVAMTWSCTANTVDSVSEWRCCLSQLKLFCVSTTSELTKEKYWPCRGLASKLTSTNSFVSYKSRSSKITHYTAASHMALTRRHSKIQQSRSWW